jgi:VanZ family protein
VHKTAAWPLALLYAGLIGYASLYPFADWRDQGLSPFAYLWQPLPRYWTVFDVWLNVIGYLPFGFLLATSGMRSGRVRQPVLAAVGVAAALSLMMEAAQSRLPQRVPSNLDFALNVFGAGAGAMAASGLERMGALARWSRVRDRWLVQDARGGIVLLALWPVALLAPTAVPLGLGQVMERLESWSVDWLADTPFLDWLPVRDIELQPMLPVAQMVCVWLGALVPCLLGYCIVRRNWRRAIFASGALTLAVALPALSSALSFGPALAWDWLNHSAGAGLALALGSAILLLFVSQRLAAALALLALGLDLGLLNQASAGPYFQQTLHAWEQGPFIRFNGLAQWLNWLWPFAVLFYLLVRAARHDGKN